MKKLTTIVAAITLTACTYPVQAGNDSDDYTFCKNLAEEAEYAVRVMNEEDIPMKKVVDLITKAADEIDAEEDYKQAYKAFWTKTMSEAKRFYWSADDAYQDVFYDCYVR